MPGEFGPLEDFGFPYAEDQPKEAEPTDEEIGIGGFSAFYDEEDDEGFDSSAYEHDPRLSETTVSLQDIPSFY